MASIVANSGRAILINRLKGSGTEPVQGAWGTGAGTAAVTDTTLFTETALNLSTTTGTRTTGSSSIVTTAVSGDTYQVVFTQTAAASGTVTNAGLFDSATIGAGNLFAKGDFTGIPLLSGDSVTFTIKAQIN